MSLIITPGQLSQRADFYHQLGQLTGAGLGLIRALEQLQRNPPAPSYRKPIAQALAELAGGCTLADALERVEHWLPALDKALLQAGEQSGRLEASFQLLTDYYIPVLGTARHYLALSRLAAALEALLNAGVTIVEAWEMAATASGSPALNRAVRAWRPLVDAGQTPAEVVRASPRFPELFANQYATGEISGRLDDTLRRLRLYYEEEGSRKLHAVAQWTPRAVYLLVVLLIAYQIIHFYLGYFGQIRDAGGW